MSNYKLVPTRDDLIQCLLATRGQSEGVTADAILSMLAAAPDVQGEPVGEVRFELGAHFGELIRALEQVDALQAERAQLHAAIRRLCNLYEVDDYYDGQLREDRLDEAVNRAIEQVKETTK